MKKINSRAKGQRGEREICKLFEQTFGMKFARTPGSGALATIGKKYNIEISGDITCEDKDFPWCIEVKSYKDFSLEQLFNSKCVIHDWWNQACEAAKVADKQPLLVFKKNNSPWYVMYKNDCQITGSYFLFENRIITLLENFLVKV